MSGARRRSVEAALTVLGPVLVLGCWELLVRTGALDARFWPPPSRLGPTAWELVRDGGLLGEIGVSLRRIGVGFALGALPAAVFGLAMGLFWPVRALLMPIASAIYAVPKIAILPLVWLVVGTDEASRYAIVAISVFFLVLLNTVTGVLAIDRSFHDVAHNFGATRLELLTTVALPGALPAIFTGFRLALGFALLVIVGTEYIRPDDGGIGGVIYDGYNALLMDRMLVALVATGLLGWLLNVALDGVERLVLPWRPGSDG